ncbi:MAG: ATP-binding cassette domain-containing protein [Lactovum sp.]
MFEIKNLTKKFKTKVLEDISVNFSEKGVSIIIGVNGSGKTTLLDCMVGIKRVTSGDLKIDGYEKESDEFKSRLFYLPSDFFLPNYMTAKEYLNFVLSRYPNSDKSGIENFLRLYDLEKEADKLLESYSFGMKKKIQLIAAILSHSHYLLADEIFSGLDFETTLISLEIFKALSKERSLIIVSHNKRIIEYFSQNILLMSDGKLTKFLGNPLELEKEILSMEKIDEKVQFIQKYKFTL